MAAAWDAAVSVCEGLIAIWIVGADDEVAATEDPQVDNPGMLTAGGLHQHNVTTISVLDLLPMHELTLAVDRRPIVRAEKLLAINISVFLYAFAIITINKLLVQLTTALNAATADAHAV